MKSALQAFEQELEAIRQAGTWREDQEADKALAEMRTIDEDLWK